MWWNLLIITVIHLVCCEDAIVTIANGKIRGLIEKTTRYNVTFYAYLGVPYAAPPIGDLRFQPPQPRSNWDDIYEATSSENACYQTQKNVTGESEDCLYLNVFTPEKPDTTSSLPVFVFIHGGGFTHGEHFNDTAPQYVLEDGVVVVSINYRLGPFGFLSTQDLVVPGNMGLKDQHFALKWVQENIKVFGGDPQKVTIAGQSAGGASVTYHMLSAQSAGLFRGAISNSASALCPWAFQRQPVDTAYGIAQTINSQFSRNKTTQELIDFLRSVSADTIKNTQDKYNIFAPVLEVPHDRAFLTQSMYTLAEQGNINNAPLMIGINSEEEIKKAEDLNKWKEASSRIDKDLPFLVSDDFYIHDTTKKMEVAKIIKGIYTNGTFEDNLGAGVQWYSDNSFVRGTIKFADLLSIYLDVYFYQFSYHGELGHNSVYITGLGRVNHAEDQRYIWQNYTAIKDYPQNDKTTLERYVRLHTNFVKTLNPTPNSSDLLQNIKWPKVDKNNFFYLDIDVNLSIQENPRAFSYNKWVNIYDLYARKPFISF